MATLNATITMTMREADRLKIVQSIAHRSLELARLLSGSAQRPVTIIRERYADFVRISAHRGRHFRLMVDGIST